MSTALSIQKIKIKVENFMQKANNKGRGEEKYGHQTAIVLKKVAGAGFVVINILSMTLFPLNGTLAAEI